jgi:hypothetical protein
VVYRSCVLREEAACRTTAEAEPAAEAKHKLNKLKSNIHQRHTKLYVVEARDVQELMADIFHMGHAISM